jgi:DNA (cytosine-5)-methyltransferase 1
MLGAYPREKLTTFPRPTDKLGRGLKAPVTIATTLARVRPDGVSLHNPRAEKIKNREAWNPDGLLPRSVTYSGGGGLNYHPSSKRDFTLREFALL